MSMKSPYSEQLAIYPSQSALSTWVPFVAGAVVGVLTGLGVNALYTAVPNVLYQAMTSTQSMRSVAPSRTALQAEIKHMIDFGARDPYDAELATGFAEKNIGGQADTFHVVKIPESARAKVGLLAKKCTPLTDSDVAFTEDEANVMRASAGPGVIINVDKWTGQIRLNVEWTADGPEKGEELMRRAQAVADEEQWPVTFKVNGEVITAELWTEARGGVTQNDFILAAKLNNLDVADLVKKPKRRIFF